MSLIYKLNDFGGRQETLHASRLAGEDHPIASADHEGQRNR